MSTNNEDRAVTREEFKIAALRERIAQIVAEYEDRIAELRIELTILSQENEQLKGQAGAEEAPQEG